MRRFLSWYGAGPLNLLAMVACFALAGYAAAELLPNNAIGIPVWFIGAVLGHDLLLMPLYTLADRSATASCGTGGQSRRLCRGSTTCASPRRFPGCCC